jgi:hypothetical protein
MIDRFGDGIAQIEIAGEALPALANKRENGLGMCHIDFVPQLAGSRQTIRVKVSKIDSQGFELGKFFRETARAVDALDFSQAVFSPGIDFSRRHHDSILNSTDEYKAPCEAPANGWSKSGRA